MNLSGFVNLRIILSSLLVLPLLSSTASSQAPSPQILLPGTFRNSEVAAQTGEKWLALVPSDTGDVLDEVRIRVQTVKDAFQDEAGASSGKKVSTDPPKDALFMVRGLGNVAAGAIKSVLPRPVSLEINKAIRLKLSEDRSYELLVDCSGTILKTADNFKTCPLVLTEKTKSQKIHEFSVYSPPDAQSIFASDAHPSLIWAGDLDRDGRLDLLLNLTNHFNISNPVLFLSSRAHDGDLAIKAAEFISYGD